jgi:eukaryotic-like serine/threonine-protein kinase
MKKGDIIRGYRILDDPTNNGGGNCVWTFAEKGGKEYFVKSFLEPKRPREGSTASSVSLRRRMEACAEFERRHRSIMDKLRPDATGGGNLVLAVDFFHEESTYYKVTERISVVTLEKPQSLDPKKKLVLIRTLALSLRLLHDINVVHGDLKPANVLIQKKNGNTYHTAKLIDFDDSYVAGQPPEREDIGGDSSFGAPEWLRYLKGDEAVGPEHLTTRADLFALGLMTHLYLTGDLPGFPDRFESPAQAVNSDVPLRVDDRLTDEMREIITDLTARAPGRRPTLASLVARLTESEICALSRKSRPRSIASDTTPSTATEPKSKRSGLRINIAGKAEPAAGTPPRRPEEPRTSRVRINLNHER